jgi:hypothetical protein
MDDSQSQTKTSDPWPQAAFDYHINPNQVGAPTPISELAANLYSPGQELGGSISRLSS